MQKSSLIGKYNVPGPRYTSYPTVPYWDAERFSISDWTTSLKQMFKSSNSKEGISLYIHLPFCESLCTFCACHKHITKRHQLEAPYIDTLIKEWKMYVALFDQKPIIKELHLGGGTPTFFSSKELKRLVESLFKYAEVHPKYNFSFEAHPNQTTLEQLQVLFDLGFTRLSLGIQDYNDKVQKAIKRVQSFQQVEKVTNQARSIGYQSISHDLIYGLPFQDLTMIKATVEKTKKLSPDRIAFYSYAHVPWVKGVGQRGFDESNLPSSDQKRVLYQTGKSLLEQVGYHEIGMDHFSLKEDALYQAKESKVLHRNFMGYTQNQTKVMIGLGMSAIGDSWGAYAQNVKTVKAYQELVAKGEFPLLRGHLLREEDLIIRKHILNLMCQFETSWEDEKMLFSSLEEQLFKLEPMQKDGLIEISNNRLRVKEEGKPFLRNVCMAFDLRLQRDKPQTKLFSMTI